MSADAAGPLEQSWMCQGWRVLAHPGLAWPKVMAPEGEIAVVVLPESWAASAEGREVGAGYAITKYFLEMYGKPMLIRGIAAWPVIAEELGARDREIAAD